MTQPSPNPGPTAPRALLGGLGLCAVIWAGADLIDQTGLQMPLMAAAVLLSALAALAAAWHQKRTSTVRDLTHALAPVLRPETTKGMIRVQKRNRRRPTQIKIIYPATYPDSDEKERAKVRELVATRLGASVEATWRRHKRHVICRLDYDTAPGDIVESDTGSVATETGDTPAQAAVRTRAGDAIQAVMGPTATVKEVRFEEGSDSPTDIRVVYATTARDLSVAYRQKVLMQVDAKLPGSWRDIWDFEENTVRFKRRPPFPTNVYFPADLAMEYGTLPYAVGEDGTFRTWVLGSKNPHHLVVGPTGSGKTVLIRSLVLSAVLQGIPVVLCDPKRTEYLDFADFPGVTLVTDIGDIAEAIMAAGRLMDQRYEEIQAGVTPAGQHGKFLFILDEFMVFKDQVNTLWAEEKRREEIRGPKDHPCLDRWGNIVVMGRTAEMHAVLGLQRPDAEIVKGALRDSFRKRTALDQHTRETAIMMWGNARTGTDLPSVQGRGMSETGRGPEEVQGLRVVPPTAEGHTEEDGRVWATARKRAADPALWEDVRIPPAFEMLKRRREDAVRQLRASYGLDSQQPAEQVEPAPRVELAKGPQAELEHQERQDVDYLPRQAASTTVEAHEGDDDRHGEWADAGVYDLETGDTVMVEDETGIPEIVVVEDLHFEETDEGEELVELTVIGQDNGSQVLSLSAEDVVRRRETQQVP
ncbi:FtsK/SpoIIIE domain-containing protein [Streptomyces sp. 891-h]|uniref:FtsK/SpoIIIE domain-containing protein n=1 Tax=Streptomyces sp. 891-h TaxID=2720714 RepID=UPI001FAACAC9|nr:FtsK/SpoIIIE domain-containing protein [Streptomyces sp. 891-h]UNZ22294.1 hypothetical protein HC362_34570 [Streptomyces sp. 891-h]